MSADDRHIRKFPQVEPLLFASLSYGFSTPWIKSEPIHLRGTQTKKIFTTLEIPPFHYYGRLRPGLFLNMYFFSTSAIGRQDVRKRLDHFNDFHKGMTDTLHKSYSPSSLGKGSKKNSYKAVSLTASIL